MKTCAYCETQFQPMRPLQAVCSPTCARRKVDRDKKQERQTTKARKEAIKTIYDLIKEAQTAFNAFIRARDSKQPCISCGKPPPDLSGLHAGRDAGHFRSTGSASHLRFDEDNCHAQCVKCNQYGAGMAIDYRISLIKRIGLERVERLESDNEVHKWTREELRRIKVIYRGKLRDLLRQKD